MTEVILPHFRGQTLLCSGIVFALESEVPGSNLGAGTDSALGTTLLHILPKVNVINNAILHNRHCEPSIKYDHYNIAYETHMPAGDNERPTLKLTLFFAIRHN